MRRESVKSSGFSGLKWGLWMQPCLCNQRPRPAWRFPDAKSGQLQEDKVCFWGQKLLSKATTHHLLALELSPASRLKSMTHTCTGHKSCACTKNFPLHFTFALICTALTNCLCHSGALVHLVGAEKSRGIFVPVKILKVHWWVSRV